MYNLGNIAVVENFYAIAQDLATDDILYALDQIDTLAIEISSDATDITDKNGRVIYQKYNAKTGTLNCSSALLSPMVMNAGSGSEVEVATDTAPVKNAPKVILVSAGATADVSDATDGTIRVIGLYGNGANYAMKQGTTADFAAATFAVSTAGVLSVPAAAEDAPIQYLVKYDRDMTSGVKLSNNADLVADVVRLTVYSAIVDPCDKKTKAAYVVAPSFQANPNMTINFDVANQNIDFNGSLQPSYCDVDKILYYIYLPDENVVLTGRASDTPKSV